MARENRGLSSTFPRFHAGTRFLPDSGLEGWLDLSAVILRLGISRKTADKWARDGTLKARKIDKRWYVHQNDCHKPSGYTPRICRFCGVVFTPKVRTARPRSFCYKDVCAVRAEAEK
jgi:hypothetical protein